MKDKPEFVYVGTKAEPFQPETFLFVASSHKVAEKTLKALYPKLWTDKNADGSRSYRNSKDGELLLFIRQEKMIQN